MRASAGSLGLYIFLGTAGYIAVAFAWIRFGDVPAFLRLDHEVKGPELTSPRGIRTVQLVIQETSERGFMGLTHKAPPTLLLRTLDKPSGTTEVWALQSGTTRDLEVADLALSWLSEDSVRFVDATGSSFTFSFARTSTQ
jgi:hypothetical protein